MGGGLVNQGRDGILLIPRGLLRGQHRPLRQQDRLASVSTAAISAFRLSHALFSSFDIDDGTRLLLKSLAQRVDLGSPAIGAGHRVRRRCDRRVHLPPRHRGAKVVMQDRDALAAAFADDNCRSNGMPQVSVGCSLAFRGLDGQFDLVTSNLPAKAGAPRAAVRFFVMHRAASRRAELRPWSSSRPWPPLQCSRLPPWDAKSTTRRRRPATPSFTTARDRRARRPLRSGRISSRTFVRRPVSRRRGLATRLQTAHSLPDFDTLGYATELAFGVARQAAISGRLLAWNPGQGHLPAGLVSRPGPKVTSVAVASRDALQCEITALNLSSIGKAPVAVRTMCSERDLGTAFAPEFLRRGDCFSAADSACSVAGGACRGVGWTPFARGSDARCRHEHGDPPVPRPEARPEARDRAGSTRAFGRFCSASRELVRAILP